MEEEIKKLQKTFEELQSNTLEFFEDEGIRYKQLKRAVSTYPSQVQLRGFETLKTTPGEDLKDIFKLWKREFVWSFLDITLLEHIVEKFGSDNLVATMQQYSHQLQDFRKRTTVYRLVKAWPDLMRPLQQTQDHEARQTVRTLNENASKCTLEKLDMLRKRFNITLKKYSLSEVALMLFEVDFG